jgi:hypothetical protein
MKRDNELLYIAVILIVLNVKEDKNPNPKLLL